MALVVMLRLSHGDTLIVECGNPANSILGKSRSESPVGYGGEDNLNAEQWLLKTKSNFIELQDLLVSPG